MADEALLAASVMAASFADWRNGAFAAAAALVVLLARRQGSAANDAQLMALPAWAAWYTYREFRGVVEQHPLGHAFSSAVLAAFSGSYLLLRLRARESEAHVTAERVAAWMVLTSALLSCSFQGPFDAYECGFRSALFVAALACVSRTLRGGRSEAQDVPLALGALFCQQYVAFAYAGALGAACVLLGGKGDAAPVAQAAKQAPAVSGRVNTRFARQVAAADFV